MTTKFQRLAYLMNVQTRVKVTNPAFAECPWVGTIIGLTENPSLILDQEGSFRVTLPQAFVVEPASEAPSSPVETTGAVSGPELRPCDSVALTEAYGQQVTLTLKARATITKQYIAIIRLKAAIAEKDDAMLTAMRNLVANNATIRQLTRERDEAVRISHEWRNKFERATRP